MKAGTRTGADSNIGGYSYIKLPRIGSRRTGIACFRRAETMGIKKGKTYDKTHYYILEPQHAGSRSRLENLSVPTGQWRIRLHYVKDVTMGEDKTRLLTNRLPKMYPCSKYLNLMRLKGYKCVKTAIDLHAHNIKTLFQWLL